MTDDNNNKSSTKWWAVGGVAAVACVAGVYLMYSSGGKKKSKRSKAAKASPTDAPKAAAAPKEAAKEEAKVAAPAGAVTEEFGRDQLVAMFRDMVTGMQEVIFGLAKLEQQMRQQGTKPDQMVATLSANYRDQMQRIQIRAFEKYNTNEEQAERASEKYHADPEFKELLHQMDVLNNALTAGVPPPDPEKLAKLPASLTVDRTIEIFTDIMETMTEAMVSSVQAVKAKHAPLPPPQQEIDNMYLEKIRLCKDNVLVKFQLDSEMLDIALQKYATDPKLSETMMALQSKQQARFMELQATISS